MFGHGEEMRGGRINVNVSVNMVLASELDIEIEKEKERSVSPKLTREIVYEKRRHNTRV